jgi:hypothetical protein
VMTRMGSITRNFQGPCVTEHRKTDSFIWVEFPEPFPDKANVVVIPMVQTFGGCNTPGIRIAGVTPKGFKMWPNETVVAQKGKNIALSDGNHREETVAWVAFAEE